MAIKYQYNKTSLQELNKHLEIREKSLPTLKKKEAALRTEVINLRQLSNQLEKALESKFKEYEKIFSIWTEFNKDFLEIQKIDYTFHKIAGVKLAQFEDLQFKEINIDLSQTPSWFFDGIHIIKDLVKISIEHEIYLINMEQLNIARKKTTQKVNLFEKVQIPGFKEAIRKIKSYLEDEENLNKSSQKIVKKRKGAL